MNVIEGTNQRNIAVVTGASSGIGEASARALAEQGWTVVCAARRTERIEAVADEIGGVAVTLDVTDQDSVDALVARLDDLDRPVDLLVHVAGGAFGLDPVAEANVEDWQKMLELNVVGSLRVVQAMLPVLRRAPAAQIIMLTSTAADVNYEGGGGYCAAKHGEAALTRTLRLELSGEPIRVCEIAPGMVATPEFNLVRFAGDSDKAAATYEGVDRPLDEHDVARSVVWAATAPAHVNVDLLVLRPVAQAAQHKVFRGHLYDDDVR